MAIDVGDVCVWAAISVMIPLAIADAGYFYRGRHRGEYVEKPEWRQQTKPWLIWEGHIRIPDAPDVSPVAVFTPEPPEGLFPVPYPTGTILDGLISFEPREDNGRVGEWGDSAFDLADSAGLCITAKTWIPGDHLCKVCGEQLGEDDDFDLRCCKYCRHWCCRCAMSESSMWACEVHGI